MRVSKSIIIVFFFCVKSLAQVTDLNLQNPVDDNNPSNTLSSLFNADIYGGRVEPTVTGGITFDAVVTTTGTNQPGRPAANSVGRMSFKIKSNSSGPTSKQCVDFTFSSPVQVVLDHWEGNGSTAYGNLGTPDSLIFSLEPTISNSTNWDFSTSSPYYASPKHSYSSTPTWQFIFPLSTTLQICGMATVNAAGNYPSSNVRVPIDIGILTSSLPVSWLKTMAVFKDGVVKILWQTASELNNMSFEIERWSNNRWLKIGEVQGSGTSNIVRNYSCSDKVQSFYNKYRIKQIDYDGEFSYSKVFDIEIKDLDDSFINNPVEKLLLLNSNSVYNEDIKILNSMGKVCLEFKKNEVQNDFDYGEIQLDVSQLASGNYTLIVGAKRYKFVKN